MVDSLISLLPDFEAAKALARTTTISASALFVVVPAAVLIEHPDTHLTGETSAVPCAQGDAASAAAGAAKAAASPSPN